MVNLSKDQDECMYIETYCCVTIVSAMFECLAAIYGSKMDLEEGWQIVMGATENYGPCEEDAELIVSDGYHFLFNEKECTFTLVAGEHFYGDCSK